MGQPVFVDSSALYALLDRSDPRHEDARRFLAANTRPLITSEYVFDEIITLIHYHFGHPAALRLGERLRASELCTLLPLSAGDFDAAWDWFCRYPDQDFSFTDCTSFAAMARMGISEAFTFDHHFCTAGFAALP